MVRLLSVFPPPVISLAPTVLQTIFPLRQGFEMIVSRADTTPTDNGRCHPHAHVADVTELQWSILCSLLFAHMARPSPLASQISNSASAVGWDLIRGGGSRKLPSYCPQLASEQDEHTHIDTHTQAVVSSSFPQTLSSIRACLLLSLRCTRPTLPPPRPHSHGSLLRCFWSENERRKICPSARTSC